MTALNLGIQESGNPEIWDPKNKQKSNFSKSKSMSPKMPARSGLVGKKHLPAPFAAISGKFPVQTLGIPFFQDKLEAPIISQEALSLATEVRESLDTLQSTVEKLQEDTYCPTKVDKQLGGPFLDFWPIRPIKK